MYNRRKFATEDDIRMSKHIFVDWKMGKNVVFFLKIAATFAVLTSIWKYLLSLLTGRWC